MANEKRLIDANAFLKDILTAGIGKTIIEYSESDIGYMIRKRPTIDAVEVVRCEKCNHAVWDEEYEMWKCVEDAEYDEESGVWFGFCEYHNGDFFCADGERKTAYGYVWVYDCPNCGARMDEEVSK